MITFLYSLPSLIPCNIPYSTHLFFLTFAIAYIYVFVYMFIFLVMCV